jgi:hypothetical protein
MVVLPNVADFGCRHVFFNDMLCCALSQILAKDMPFASIQILEHYMRWHILILRSIENNHC